MAVFAIVVVVLVGIGVLGYLRYSPIIDDVRGLRDTAQRLAADARSVEPTELDRATVARLRDGLGELDERIAPLRDLVQADPLVSAARVLPGLGPQIDAAHALVDATESLVEAGQAGLLMADEFVDLREANDRDPAFAMMPGLVGLIAESAPRVDHISDLIAEAEARLAEIPPDAVQQVLEARDLVAEPLAEYRPLLEQYREADDVLARILGWGDEKRYLVLAQNPAELRPAGGYAGTIGILAFRDGALVEQNFQDVYDLDLKKGLPFIEPPEELASHLLGNDQSWRLADAAWSADFPTGAAKAIEFYELESGETQIDGVIAMTTFALDRLLEVVGAVTVDEFDVTVEPGDTTQTILGVTRGTPTSIKGRKDILDELAQTVMQRLLALPPDQWIPMMEALLDIGDRKLALAWFDDPEAQAMIDESGWGGRVIDAPGDYIYALEANMAPTSKYNLVVDRSASLVAKIGDEGDALNSLRLDWHNRAGAPGEPYRSLREFSNNQDGWYGAYLRLLVPQGSELVTASGKASDEIRGTEQLPDDAERAVYGNYLFMPPGESTMSYLWTAPASAVKTDDGWEYRLTIQKQPGARPEPWKVRIDLPDGAETFEVPQGATVAAGRVLYETVLADDEELIVRYSLPGDES